MSGAAPISAVALAGKFADHFLPVVQASVDLLETGEADFEARCRRMLDAAGTVMVDELCAEIETVSRQMRLLCDGSTLRAPGCGPRRRAWCRSWRRTDVESLPAATNAPVV